MRVLGRAVGVRSDLNLHDRWWHRLFLVGFVLFLGATATVVAFLRGEVSASQLAPHQRVVTSDLFSFVQDYSGYDEVDAADAFDAQDGWLDIEATDLERPVWFYVVSAFTNSLITCKAEGGVFGGSTAEDLYIIASERNGTTIVPLPNRPEEEADVVTSLCWGPVNIQDVPASTITLYRPSLSAQVLRWIGNAALGSVVAAGLGLLLAFGYYRGVIYIAFGPPKH